ncbi:hypothetical protein LTR78_008917 [Recurvomyces mirabilis]|uniref:Uncharacterized protein n=1 Tax=Recurvomyces mirabilis TaxID=574656 RepID=A0AAE0TUB9_9PEZI|nr:hypothetical protein LTR78_008917 [Recurvomyces mirabilis]KAK5155832.1 hypothetical protein LTS14_005398 [Recurvomyces mirabilis]
MTTTAGGAEDPISPVGQSKPELTISAAAINNVPVELDAKATAIDQRRGSRGQVLEEMSPHDKEKRQQLISERQGDMAVLVDIPQTPDADEFEQAEAVTTDDKP